MSMSPKEAWRVASANAFKFAAVICFVLAVLLTLLNNVAAGTLMAGLFVVTALLHYLPQLESFKAYGVEAKWRQRITEADELISKLRQAAKLSAAHMYHTLGWGGRWGGDDPKKKQAFADQVDSLLTELGVEDEEISKLKGEYLQFFVLDVFSGFEFSVIERARKRLHDVSTRINAIGNKDSEPEMFSLRNAQNALSVVRSEPENLKNLAKFPFKAYCLKRIEASGLPAEDSSKLSSLAGKWSEIVERCLKSGRIDEEGFLLLESSSYAQRSKLLKETFDDTV